jgi:hypothetical protein
MSGQQFKYDYIVVGRWRNRDQVNAVKQALRDAGKYVYCFTDNAYDGDGIKFETRDDADVEAMMTTTEKLTDWQTNPTFRKILNRHAGLKGIRSIDTRLSSRTVRTHGTWRSLWHGQEVLRHRQT